MKDSFETGFLFHTPAGPFNFFFTKYTGRIFLYITKAKNKKNPPKHMHTYTNLCDHWAVQWSSTMVLLVYLIASINNDYILARATFRPPIPVLWSPYLKWNWPEIFFITKYLKLRFSLALEFAPVLNFLDPSLRGIKSHAFLGFPDG